MIGNRLIEAPAYDITIFRMKNAKKEKNQKEGPLAPILENFSATSKDDDVEF